MGKYRHYKRLDLSEKKIMMFKPEKSFPDLHSSEYHNRLHEIFLLFLTNLGSPTGARQICDPTPLILNQAETILKMEQTQIYIHIWLQMGKV